MCLFPELQHQKKSRSWMLQCRFIGMETVRPCKFVQFVNGTGKWSFGKIVVINDDIIFGNPNTTDCTASGLPDLPAPFCPHPIIQEDRA